MHRGRDTKTVEQNEGIIARDGDRVSREVQRQQEKERGGKKETEGGKAGRKRRRRGLMVGRGAKILGGETNQRCSF